LRHFIWLNGKVAELVPTVTRTMPCGLGKPTKGETDNNFSVVLLAPLALRTKAHLQTHSADRNFTDHYSDADIAGYKLQAANT